MPTGHSREVAAGRRAVAEAEAAVAMAVISLQRQRQEMLILEVRARETPEAEYHAARTWASVMSTTDSTARDAGGCYPLQT